MAKEKKQIQINLSDYARNEQDCGSSEYQVAKLSKEIQYLTGHCTTHKKDKSAIRGLVQKVNDRKRLLKYIHRIDFKLFQKLIKELDIRYRIST